ncbi:MAG TPA: hypothetical protein DEQ88_02230 [Clostridiales bacterium]|nr:hypothetical protein [Clostridiales bacterium]
MADSGKLIPPNNRIYKQISDGCRRNGMAYRKSSTKFLRKFGFLGNNVWRKAEYHDIINKRF